MSTVLGCAAMVGDRLGCRGYQVSKAADRGRRGRQAVPVNFAGDERLGLNRPDGNRSDRSEPAPHAMRIEVHYQGAVGDRDDHSIARPDLDELLWAPHAWDSYRLDNLIVAE